MRAGFEKSPQGRRRFFARNVRCFELMARRGTFLATFAAAATITALAAAGASAATAPSFARASAGEYVPGEVIVRFRAGVDATERRTTLAARGVTSVEPLALARTQVVKLAEGASVEDAVRAFERDPDVLFAEPNYLYKLSAVPNDTLFAQLWGLHQGSDVDIDAPEAWDTTTGSPGVVVAVIDSGIEYGHPDLAANIWVNAGDPAGGGDQDKNGYPNDTRGWDFVQNDNTPRDPNGHGTHVAGTIGARGNNALGITGVNWNVKLMPLRAADANGSLANSWITNAIKYACNKKARVVNGSFGGGAQSSATTTAINSAACAKTLFVFAAGNEGENNDSTGSFPCNTASARIICVGATTTTDGLASFSNFGATNVDLAAPGTQILSTEPAFSTVLSDGFENTPTAFSTRWGGQIAPGGHPTWNQTSAVASSGTFSMTDSPGGQYSASTDSHIRSLAPFSLAGRTGCLLDYDLRLQTELDFDFFSAYASTVFNGTYTDVSGGGWSGSTGGSFFLFTDDLSQFDGKSAVHLLFRLQSDNVVNDDGAYVDDLVVRCLTSQTAPGEYQELQGTSMATPHVAGAAALLLARNPALTVAQLRSRILTTVDPVAGLSGLVATGGRLNVGNAMAATGPPPPCKVPKLKGKTLAGAKSALAAKFCRLGVVKKAFSSTVRKGRVMKQTKAPGATLAYNAKVGVTISKGRR